MKKSLFIMLSCLAVVAVGLSLAFTTYKIVPFNKEPEVTSTNEVVAEEPKSDNQKVDDGSQNGSSVGEHEASDAKEPYASKQIKPNQTVEFVFDKPVDESTVTNQTVSVATKKGDAADIEFTIADGGTVLNILPPKEGFEVGQEYVLALKKGIQYEDGEELSDEIQQPFIIVSDDSSENDKSSDSQQEQEQSASDKSTDVTSKNDSQSSTEPSTTKHPLNGEWSRNVQGYEGGLTISNATDNSFDFALLVNYGAEYGEVKGKATIKGKQATFIDTKDDSGCQLTFSLSDSAIEVKQNQECRQFHGPHVDFEGTYDKGTANVKTKTLADQGILTVAEDADIREMVGDQYQLLLDSTLQSYDDKDIDGLDAKVIYGSAPGLNGIRQSIIMVDGYGYYYVGLIINGEMLRLYTTNSSFKATLPKTVDAWRQPFKEYPVDFYYTSLRAK